ncbi:MAG: aminopeptidase P family protein [Anaerolineales bacterium]|nr:aminopeptidase P family protein [Anaerolineales bacterium]
MDDFSDKRALLLNLAARHALDAILLQRVSSIAWLTSGAAAYVNTARSEGEACLLVTPEHSYLFTNNIEAPRLEEEEGLGAQGWDFQVVPWFEATGLPKIRQGLKLGSDSLFPGASDLSTEIASLRAQLTTQEGKRFRTLGSLCAQAMDAAARSTRPGQSEYEIAGLLAGEAQQRGVQAIVILIATDERIFRFRHPLPTAKKLGRYAMLVLCGRRQGLVCSITRLIHFGRLSEEIQRKAEAVARIDAAMIAATRPGRSLGDIFQVAVDEYARTGYPDEWRLHHQGGPAGYEPREAVARPNATQIISNGQAYAWNPSITGTKSEDTILVGETGNDVLTAIPGWPKLEVDIGGSILERPAILIVE